MFAKLDTSTFDVLREISKDFKNRLQQLFTVLIKYFAHIYLNSDHDADVTFQKSYHTFSLKQCMGYAFLKK